MNVNYSGWTEKYGTFNCDIFIDEAKQDYEITYGDGSISKQQTPFEHVTGDWNNDGDVYTQFGAWFGRPGESGATFWTPVDLVYSVVEAQSRTRKPYGNEVVAVKGVEVPLPDKRPKLEDTLRNNERRAMHQEIERNRRMNAMGIRPPYEPWVR